MRLEADEKALSRGRLMTVNEVADYLQVSRAHVYTLPIRFSKVGRVRRYDPQEVRLYVELHSSRTLRAS